MTEHVQIIMIEDDEATRASSKRIFAGRACSNEILPFANGTEALKFLFGSATAPAIGNRGRAMLIMLDLNLPDMSGVDILRRVKRKRASRNAHLSSC